MIRRASSAPLYAKCPAAAYGEAGEVVIHRVDEYGAFGTAVHEAGAKLVQGIEFDTGELAARYGLDDAAKRRMLWMISVIWRWWTKHGEAFTRDDGTLWVLDFKTTRLKDVQYDPQLFEYLWLALAVRNNGGLPSGLMVETELAFVETSGHPDVMFVPQTMKQCRYVILFLEDETHFVSPPLDPKEILERHVAYDRDIRGWDQKTYSPGGHCWYCGRAGTCRGLHAELANSTHFPTLQADDAEGRLAKLTDAQCVCMWDHIGLAIKFLERAREIIKVRAIAGGNVLLGEGRKLTVEEQIRHPLKPLEAWPILKQYLSDAELAPAVSVSKTVALAAIAAKAPRGQKGKLKEKVEAELEAADAFTEERIMFPRLVPSKGASREAMIEGS